MAVDVKQYIEQLAQSAGLSQEEKDAILKVSSNEKFSKALGDDILRQQDYSRNMDTLRAEQQKAVTEREKSVKYYADLLTWKAEEEAKLQTALGNGNGQNGQNGQQVLQPVQGDFISKKEFQETVQQINASTVNLLKEAMGLTSRHNVEFPKEPLDPEAIIKLAQEKQLSIRAAYDEYAAPRRAENSKAQHDAELVKAREEGAREYASKHHIPVDAQPREYRVMLDRDPTKQVGTGDYVPNSGRLSHTAERQLRDNFVEAWNTPTQANTSGT